MSRAKREKETPEKRSAFRGVRHFWFGLTDTVLSFQEEIWGK
jgi:hypothetical protein